MHRGRADEFYMKHKLRQQRNAVFAFTLCRPRDFPAMHNDCQQSARLSPSCLFTERERVLGGNLLRGRHMKSGKTELLHFTGS